MSSDKLVLSAYGSHNGAVAMYYKGQYWVVEAERWLNSKNIGISNYMPCRNYQLVFDEITEWLLSQTDKSHVDVYMTGYLPHIKPKFRYNEMVGVDHHSAHAACTFYQSPYKEALIFTFDGGGDAGYFNVYTADRTGGIKLIDKFNQDLGFPYMILSDYLADIKKESLSIGNLVYAGKLMGLCSYGTVHDEWLPFFLDFYEKFNYMGNSYIGGAEARHEAIKTLMTQIGVENFDFEDTRLEGQLAWDIAATTQRAFEEFFFKFARKYLDQYPDMPVCLAGGCALNVLLNTRLAKERNGKVFIPPNTSDCGIAAGQLLHYQAPEHQVDLTYSGLPIMDANQLGYYLEDRQYATIENVGFEDLATYIHQGFIVGFIQGNSEHGSRALGNRSIICNPGIKEMKDILNEKVKHREWYRPFAPLVKLEHVDKYFDFYGDDCRHMTFVADVKEEWREKMPAITHQDNTGRLQTVTRWQNEAIYDLLTEFEKVSDHGVLLNTSFNDNGKPILTRYSDALNLLRNTKLDAVYVHERKLMIFKNGDERKFKKSLEVGGLSDVSLDTTVNVLVFPKDDAELNDSFIPTLKKLVDKTERITIVTSVHDGKILSNVFAGNKNVRFHLIPSTLHYQNTLIHGKTKTGFEQYDRDSTYFFSLFIRPFWVKEVMRDNVFNTKYHLFIDLSYMEEGYNYNITRDIKVLSDFAKDDGDAVGITGVKGFKSTVFDAAFLNKNERWKAVVDSDIAPWPYIFYGNVETIEWFSNHFEAMLLWWLTQDRVGKLEDYIFMSYAESQHHYKFLELEKVDDNEA
jgi:carbamoyltransferase